MTSPVGSVASTWPTSSAQSNPMAAARSNVMTAVSSELGISPAQLQSQLQSGKSLSQIASAAGISSDALNATVTSALQQSGLPAGTNVAALATRMTSHVGGHHHHHGASSSVAPASSTDSTTGSASSTSGSLVSTYA